LGQELKLNIPLPELPEKRQLVTPGEELSLYIPPPPGIRGIPSWT
jgi:hypothetical protein